MNDRFKFRIYDLEQKHYLRVIQDETTGAEGFAAFYGKYNNICKPMSFFLCHDTDRWDIEQCTGLKDKNGNLIYEGDLIKSPNNSYMLEVVRMPNGVYGCKVCKISPVWEMNLYSLINAYDVEIIGNIHKQAEQKD